jgi:hypothetical protein
VFKFIDSHFFNLGPLEKSDLIRPENRAVKSDPGLSTPHKMFASSNYELEKTIRHIFQTKAVSIKVWCFYPHAYFEVTYFIVFVQSRSFYSFFLRLSNDCVAPRQLTKNGIILSWAVEGQGGTDHVNEQNNTVIVQVSSDPVVDLLQKSSNKIKKISPPQPQPTQNNLPIFHNFHSTFKNPEYVHRTSYISFSLDICTYILPMQLCIPRTQNRCFGQIMTSQTASTVNGVSNKLRPRVLAHLVWLLQA